MRLRWNGTNVPHRPESPPACLFACAGQTETDDFVPAQAESGVRLVGDSMEPRFADGQLRLAEYP